jgi:hypothetical protein
MGTIKATVVANATNTVDTLQGNHAMLIHNAIGMMGKVLATTEAPTTREHQFSLAR